MISLEWIVSSWAPPADPTLFRGFSDLFCPPFVGSAIVGAGSPCLVDFLLE
jgi:hypothetical protein